MDNLITIRVRRCFRRRRRRRRGLVRGRWTPNLDANEGDTDKEGDQDSSCLLHSITLYHKVIGDARSVYALCPSTGAPGGSSGTRTKVAPPDRSPQVGMAGHRQSALTQNINIPVK